MGSKLFKHGAIAQVMDWDDDNKSDKPKTEAEKASELQGRKRVITGGITKGGSRNEHVGTEVLMNPNGNGFTFDQEDLARFFILYQELMGFWHKSFPNKIHDISYERLTTHQEDETQKLLKYCELDWDNNCLNFHKNTRAVHTASASQVRQKMYQGSSDAWKKYEKFLEPLVKSLKDY